LPLEALFVRPSQELNENPNTKRPYKQKRSCEASGGRGAMDAFRDVGAVGRGKLHRADHRQTFSVSKRQRSGRRIKIETRQPKAAAPPFVEFVIRPLSKSTAKGEQTRRLLMGLNIVRRLTGSSLREGRIGSGSLRARSWPPQGPRIRVAEAGLNHHIGKP